MAAEYLSMRSLQLVGFMAIQAVGSLICYQTFAAEPSKPIQECEQEFRSREVSLRSEGISAASFFHECWWHSRRGHPTEISSDGARDRVQRVQQDADATRLWTAGTATAQASTGDHRRSASLIDRREKRREARLQRRVNRIIAARAQRLVLAAHSRHEGRRAIVAEAREKGQRLRIREEGLAVLSRRNAKLRERYALDRLVREKPAAKQIIEASAAVPANAVDGRRSWIGTNTVDGSRKIHAVVIGALQTTAVKGTALHCWDQNVLFLNGQERWQQALVCDNKIEASAQNVWFEQYETRR